MDAILGWFSPTRWIMVAVLAAVMVAGYFAWADHQQDIGETRATTRYNGMIEAQKEDARKKLAKLTQERDDAQSELNGFKSQQELKDAENRKILGGVERRLADATAVNGGKLRDPNARPRGGCPSPQGGDTPSPSDRPTDVAETGGLLSAPLTRLLQLDTRESDEINIAYASCREDAINVRRVLEALH